MNIRKQHRGPRASFAPSVATIKELISPRRRGHEANFKNVLPTTMKKLLDEGLFEPDGQGSYKITDAGLRKLKELT